ncbi:MAG: 4-phosphoerythronate dehydrogenase PdxB [Ignavibacterium sp.]
MKKLKLVIDENISFAEEVFSQFGEIKLINGREINNDILKDADILLVRSLTKVNENLLKGTTVKFVGTATIGIDHIDLEYLNKNNIAFAYSKGCNADAVTEYVFSTLINLCYEKKIELSELSIGIIGVGNIGSRVAKISNSLNLKVFLNDPPLERAKDNKKFSSLEECLNANIITFHTPLNRTGIDKTHHLFNKEKIKFVKDDAIFINTSRGEVVETEALLKLIDEKNVNAIIDVWENEPLINEELLNKVKIGTPHIAGYSFEGKLNGTKMLFDALNNFLKSNYHFPINLPNVNKNVIEVSTPDRIETGQNSIEEILKNIFNKIYDIKEDYKKLRKILSFQQSEKSNHKKLLIEKKKKYFDDLRKNYPMRREFINEQIHLNPYNEKIANILKSFRFTVI